MDTIYAPFIGILPTKEQAQAVVAPPYDVLSSAEAKAMAANHPHSFLHISKAEIDLPEHISPYADEVYAKAAENFNNLLTQGILRKTTKPCYYIYQMDMAGHVQTGLAVAASVKAYNEGRIKRHELTRVIKENDRVKQIKTVGAQTGPALLINKNLPAVKKFLAEFIKSKLPDIAVTGEHEVHHRLWIIDNETDIEFITKSFAVQDEAYIADGHHRSAAASRLAEEGLADRFLAVAFFAEEMKIYDYNRFVHDLQGRSPSMFLQLLEQDFKITLTEQKKPSHKGEFTMYLDKRWYRLEYIGTPLGTDPVSSLDVSLLSTKVLNKLLNITDLRNDERIEFVGGIRGAEEIEKLVNSRPQSVGFMVYPTSVAELLSVADRKMLMPPKSTWFEPKLADGMISK